MYPNKPVPGYIGRSGSDVIDKGLIKFGEYNALLNGQGLWGSFDANLDSKLKCHRWIRD
jgi:hypothetical protein